MTPRRAADLGMADGVALGCGLRVVTTESRRLAPALSAVQAVLRDVDEACSRFRPDSELTFVNDSAGREVHVSELLATALSAAFRAARISGGAVDPTVGRALKIVGYDRDFAAVLSKGRAIPLRVLPIPGWRSIRFDAVRRTVRVPLGVELDLGATAKPLAADIAAGAAAGVTGSGVLVSLGGDMAMRGEPPHGGWTIQVGEDSRQPIRGGQDAVSVSSGGLATSSTTVRRWLRGRTELHHIIDPRTGLPARGPWRTATAFAATALDANIASTTAVVLGEDALAWVAMAKLPVRLVDRTGRVVRAAGWPGAWGPTAA